MRLLRRPIRRRSQPVATDTAISTDDMTLFNYLCGCVLPRQADTHDHYVPSRLIGKHGIELHEEEQLARIDTWRSEPYQALYSTLRNDERINCPFAGTSYLGRTCLHNGWYPTPDAEIYASMIYDFRPDQIIEIGSGFSTLIARRALDYARHDASLVVIDPSPRTDVEHVADRVIYECVESAKLNKSTFTGRSLLFIDSSHITRVRGDVPYLYCELLPQLPMGTIVHFHDIFIPYDYPSCYDHLCWTEQYVLQSLLTHSPRYRTLLSTQYLSRHHTDQMQATFGPEVGSDNLFFGASYWIQIQ